MARKCTVKDVQAALQFGGEKLLRTYVSGKPAVWTLSKTGTPVPLNVANEVMSSGNLVMYDNGLFDSPQSYGWKE